MLFDRFAVLLVAIVVASAAAQQVPRGYEVAQVTNGAGPEWLVELNNHGQMVWVAQLGPTEDDREIFLYDDRTRATTRLTNNAVQDLAPDINDHGAVVWQHSLTGKPPQGEADSVILMRLPNGEVFQVSQGPPAFHSQPRINNAHQVAWVRLDGDGCQTASRTIMFFDGLRIVEITANEWSNDSVSLNDLGDISWSEKHRCSGPWTGLIKLRTGGKTLTLSEPGQQAQLTSLNNSGACAWQFYDLSTSEDGVYIWQDGERRLLAGDDASNVAINNHGDAYFIRWQEPQGYQAWLWLRGRFYQITDDPFWNTDGDINDLGECAWASGGWPNANIMFMRRLPRGDLNCDRNVNALDIEGFVLALTDPDRYATAYPSCDRLLADLNGDDAVDAFDIEPFVDLLIP